MRLITVCELDQLPGIAEALPPAPRWTSSNSIKMAALMNKTSMRLGAGRVAPKATRPAVKVGAAREMWYPGATAPAHLDGSMLGDYGFDPLRLGVNADRLKWFREAELTNGRWAMAAVAGILFTDLVGLPKWWEAGAQQYAIDTVPLAVIEIAVFAFLEACRYDGYKRTGATGVAFFFPFDPLNMRSKEMELKELKNGRLAMLAFLGFASTAAVNGQTPLESLKAHLADPNHNNIYTSAVGKETAVTVAVLSVLPIIIEATKSLSKKESVPLFPWNEEWTKVAKN